MRRNGRAHGLIADFYCAQLHLVIELDGGVHEGVKQKAWDLARDEVLGQGGIAVIRLRNREVSREVLVTVIQAAQNRMDHPIQEHG